MGSPEMSIERHKNFDPQFCGTFFKIAAVICIIFVLCTALLLTTANSSTCPGWWMPTSHGESESAWIPFAMTGLWTLNVSYHAITWQRFAQRVVDRIQSGERTFIKGTKPSWYGDRDQFQAFCASSINFNWLFSVGLFLSILIAASPLIEIAIRCF
jgi:hypothetical protein